MYNRLFSAIDLSKVILQPVNLQPFTGKYTEISVLRLDLIHPEISGNKWFKLKYHLRAMQKKQYEKLLTFGGAWSNHLLATAEACRIAGIPSAAIIRGEKPANLSPVLQDLLSKNMQLKFVSRNDYQTGKNELAAKFFPGYYVVPEGGAGLEGIEGAAEIMDLIPSNYTYICCSIGTGTTFYGLIKNSNKNQNILGFSSLKINTPNEFENNSLQFNKYGNAKILYDYHFGGYGKSTEGLQRFINEFAQYTGILTDKVYTSKMVWGVIEEIKNGHLPPDAKICIIHCGGISGNRTL